MREIKFRGKPVNPLKSPWNAEWYYGLLHYAGNDRYAICSNYIESKEDFILYEVYPNTIGQFTGLYDKNGKEIYEGDIVLYHGDIKFVVKYHHGGFGYTTELGDFLFGGNSNFSFNPNDKDYKFEVIGNIHDNPELLKGGKQ